MLASATAPVCQWVNAKWLMWPRPAGIRGTVFRARYEGKPVAVKVVRFTDPNGRVRRVYWFQLATDCKSMRSLICFQMGLALSLPLHCLPSNLPN